MDKNQNTIEDLATTKGRDMREVEREARAREATAVRNGRLSDAALYREIGDRAQIVADREAEVGYARRTAAGDERERLARSTRVQRRLAVLFTMLAGVSLLLVLSGCASNMPPIRGPVAGALEIGTGFEQPAGRGSNDIADAGPSPFVELGGALTNGDKETGVAGEWFMRYGRTDAEDVDAGVLGLFDLEADSIRFGVGLRLGTRRVAGLDWGLGLGACLTVVRGTATAGPISRDVSEGGLGAYASATASRGPFYLRATYIDGPEADIDGYDVQLGGASLSGGLRWAF